MGLQDNYKVGDKVVMTDFTAAGYSKEWVEPRLNKEAEVLSVHQKTISYEKDLDKESRPLWRALYGLKPTYTLYGMYIRFDGEKERYLVSNLGFRKVSES